MKTFACYRYQRTYIALAYILSYSCALFVLNHVLHNSMAARWAFTISFFFCCIIFNFLFRFHVRPANGNVGVFQISLHGGKMNDKG